MHPSVHPAVIHHWKRARHADACGVSACCHPGTEERPDPEYSTAPGAHGFEGGAFGVKRPLRLLAYKLDLDETQVAEMARILDELKTERAQAAVDDRRTLTTLADVISGETFDEARASQGLDLRSKATARVGDAVVKALGRMHKLLNTEQRERLAYLIRTGTLVF
jgi:Spy/CpxP family protein refolding chaperone